MEQAQPKAQQLKTYRVRQLPSHVDELQTVDLLVRLIDGLESRGDVQVFSLASNADPWERPPTKVATVGFPSAPAIFEDGRDEWVFAELGLFRNVIIDTHFLDFTVLNQVPRDEHTLNLIAISGLASHPFGSWRSRASGSNFMWLRDGLPKDLPGIRNILYGYDTKLLSSQSFQEIEDLAITLVIKLKSLGLASGSARPLIFVAHSLGGIIFKRAVVTLANGNDAERAILQSIKSALLFGVPNLGMTTAHLLPMVSEQPNEGLVKCLSVGSEYLRVLGEQFNGIVQLEKLRLVSIYETAKSRTTKEVSPGSWDRSGPYEILVERSSAIHSACRVTDTFPVDKDHSNMVKFSENDSNYRGILGYIHEVHGVATLRIFGETSVSEAHIPPSDDEGPQHEIALSKQINVSSSTTNPDRQTSSIRGVDAATSDVKPSVDEIIDVCMRGLYTEESEFRVKHIDDAVEATYHWILDNPSLGFVDWLQQREGMFWISGKPGSGKSTLMKYIWKSKRTKQYLSGDTRSGNQVLASFFFHDRGSALQKSFEGLLRSILYQILQADPSLQKQVLSSYSRLYRRSPPYWHLSELEDLFQDIVNQDKQHIDITLLLDALDEYEGSLPLFVEFLKSSIERKPMSTTRVKICFSSRQWPIFDEHFQHCPGFRIHEHTSQDMLEFIDDRKSRTLSLPRLMSTTVPSNGGKDVTVAQYIVQKAQGVFLWVKLTMDALSRWATDGFSPNEISDILSKIPGDLETFYEHILAKIDRAYCMECYIMLEIALRSEIAMGLIQFSEAVNCAFQSTVPECQKIIYDNGVRHPEWNEANMDDFQRRIKSRCGGLLEIIRDDNRTCVQLMHQTVRDFVSRPGFKRLVLREAAPLCTENGFSYLSKSSLASLIVHTLHPLHSSLSVTRYGQDLSQSYARKAELTTGISQRTFLKSIKDEDLYKAYSVTRNVYDSIPDWVINSVSTFAISAGLQLFLAEELHHDPLSVNHNPEISLLHSAMEYLGWYAMEEQEISPSCDPLVGQSICNIVQLLLQHGADDTVRHAGLNPLQYLVERATSRLSDHFWHPRFATTIAPYVFSAALALLDHSNNSTVPITLHARNGTDVVCTLLHVVSCLWYQPKVTEAVKVLLKQGANVNECNSRGQTPLDVLIGSVCLSGSNLSQTQQYLVLAKKAHTVLRLLVEAGAHVNSIGVETINEFLQWLGTYYDVSALRQHLEHQHVRQEHLQHEGKRARLRRLFRKGI